MRQAFLLMIPTVFGPATSTLSKWHTLTEQIRTILLKPNIIKVFEMIMRPILIKYERCWQAAGNNKPFFSKGVCFFKTIKTGVFWRIFISLYELYFFRKNNSFIQMNCNKIIGRINK